MAKQRNFVKKEKKSTIKCEYRPWAEWSEGDMIVGKYVQQATDSYKKPNFILEVLELSWAKKPKLAKSIVGKNFGMNSAGKLDAAMEQVKIGEIVQVEYKGCSKIAKGPYKGKDSHDFEVDTVVDEDDVGEEDEVSDDDLDDL